MRAGSAPAPAKEQEPFGSQIGRRSGLQDVAADGVQGAGGRLPFADAIQASFGAHDLNGVRAHVSGDAGASCDAIGAEAYATGGDVAFRDSPDLHTVAHEAAHVVQQRAGVHLKGGVGRAGDHYEQHADAVADLVVQGKSAESLLGPTGQVGGAGAGLQRKGEKGGGTPRQQQGERLQDLGSPTILELVEFRRSDTSGAIEYFPEHVIVGDEVFAELSVDKPLSSETDSSAVDVESAGQLEMIQLGALGDGGLRFFFRARAGSQPTIVRAFHESGGVVERVMNFEVLSEGELVRRAGDGSFGASDGETRGPRSTPKPYAKRIGERPASSAARIKTSSHHRERYSASSGGVRDQEGLGYSYANAELDRSEKDPRTRGSARSYGDNVAEKEIQGDLPQPVPSRVGSLAYYRARHDDFLRRHPALTPPDYYLDYGAKYAYRFTLNLFSELSPEGRRG